MSSGLHSGAARDGASQASLGGWGCPRWDTLKLRSPRWAGPPSSIEVTWCPAYLGKPCPGRPRAMCQDPVALRGSVLRRKLALTLLTFSRSPVRELRGQTREDPTQQPGGEPSLHGGPHFLLRAVSVCGCQHLPGSPEDQALWVGVWSHLHAWPGSAPEGPGRRAPMGKGEPCPGPWAHSLTPSPALALAPGPTSEAGTPDPGAVSGRPWSPGPGCLHVLT